MKKAIEHKIWTDFITGDLIALGFLTRRWCHKFTGTPGKARPGYAATEAILCGTSQIASTYQGICPANIRYLA
jgi:hypothetical protein